MFADLYVQLAHLGIDVLGESQLVGFPGQFPSVTMLDWNTGQPNARYWVLKLLRDNFEPPIKMVESNLDIPYIHAQAFVTESGERKVLLINKRDRNFEIEMAGASGAHVATVDQTTGAQSAAITKLDGDKLTLRGLAVAVVTMPRK
jgi:hypothetical protein